MNKTEMDLVLVWLFARFDILLKSDHSLSALCTTIWDYLA